MSEGAAPSPEGLAALPYRPCAGVCLTDPGDRVWVGERLDKPGAWQMPQGGIDPGEAPHDAALRELWEETGLPASAVVHVADLPGTVRYELPPDMVGRLWKGRYRGQEQHWARYRYDGPDDAVDLDAHVREFARWRWMAPAEVLDHIVPFKRDVYVAVFRGFGLLR